MYQQQNFQNNHGYQTQQQQPPAHAGFAFPLDEDSAEKAGAQTFLAETGAYNVTITSAQYVRAQTGTHGVKLRLETADGLQGSVILNYMKANNEPIFGANFLNAILYLAGLGGFSWHNAMDEKGQMVQMAKELHGVNIGLVLEAVPNQNKEGTHLEVRQVFQPQSRITAGEARQGLKPEAVAKLLKRLGVE